MSLIKNLKNIKSRNGFHAIITLTLLYMEKAFYFKFPFKILRKLIIQGLYSSEILPDSFRNKEAIATCRLPHPYLIIIHRTASIGINSTIFHNVTIGVIEGNNRKLQASYLGDNIYIGCDSAILGNLTIGKNVKIGAKSLILKEIKDNQTVVGLYK